MNVQIAHSNIELEGYYVRDLQFSVSSDLDETGKLLLNRGFHVQLETPAEIHEYQISISVNAASHDTDKNRYRLVLGLSSLPPPESQPPYEFKLTIVGFFRLIGMNVPRPTREPAIVQSSIGILYAAAREVLAAATARGPFPAMILPIMRISVATSKPVPVPRRLAQKRPPKKVARKK